MLPIKTGRQYADVLVEVSVKIADHPFQYVVPEALSDKVRIGAQVIVSFGGRMSLGHVIELQETPRRERLKEIIDVVEGTPVITDDMLSLSRWMSEYYLCSVYDCVKMMIPPGAAFRLRKRFEFDDDKAKSLNDYEQLSRLLTDIHFPASKQKILSKIDSNRFAALKRRGILKKIYFLDEPKDPEKFLEEVSLTSPDIEPGRFRGIKQQAIIRIVRELGNLEVNDLLKKADASRDSIKTLVKKGVLRVEKKLVDVGQDWKFIRHRPEIDRLTTDQNLALRNIRKAIDNNENKAFLLEGVTGSGKTEVYIRSIAEVLNRGRGAIVLVPEIALTHQIGDAIISRFPDNAAVIHSGMTPSKRIEQWNRLKKGEAAIAIGARSALFAPIKDIGLIIIDEEHETSYKQNRNPRYNVREAALQIARIKNAVVVFGSATPSLESRYLCDNGEITRLNLPERVGDGKMPVINVLDMREIPVKKGSAVSDILELKMKQCLIRDEKVIVFLNRRGYSAFLLCRDCGYVPRCLNCSVSLTYHKDDNRLICHHCRYSHSAFSVCPKCGGHNIRYMGAGTQRVENELRQMFPDIPVIRMDADTTAGKDSHHRLLDRFDKMKKAILLGTQMVAKGLDFPEVGLIGVINADVALNLPDFRAGERTFQMLSQVAGRSGRGEIPGEVFIQTFSPDNYAIIAAKKGDYQKFYDQEMSFRRELDYPPFSKMINIVVSGPVEKTVEERAVTIFEYLDDRLEEGEAALHGPGVAPIPKIKNRWRWHLFILTTFPNRVKSILSENWQTIFSEKKGTRVTVDVDPTWIL